MPKYSDAMHPEAAAQVYGGVPGNYILFDRWGRAYPGRQGLGVNRIAAHLRNHPGEFATAHFMIDHDDDPCRRASREETAVANLLDDRVPIRNKRWPANHAGCRRR